MLAVVLETRKISAFQQAFLTEFIIPSESIADIRTLLSYLNFDSKNNVKLFLQN